VRALVFVLVGLALLAVGAFLGLGLKHVDRVVYEATTPESKLALASRIEVLRTVLRADSRFEERKEAPLFFIGSDWLRFSSCAVIYTPSKIGDKSGGDSMSKELVPGSDRLGIVLHHNWRPWSVHRRMQNQVEEALGPEVVKQLKVTVRHYFLQ
jgi:hypothetical protein